MNALENQNKLIKEKNGDHLQLNEMLKIDNKVLEAKTEKLESENTKQDDLIEELYREISDLKQKEVSVLILDEENRTRKIN